MKDKFFGPYQGYLRDAKDPENRGRIRCHCPEIMGNADNSNQWLDWALPTFPWLVRKGVGLNFIPTAEYDKWGVWLLFRQGDPRFPTWFGLFPWQPVDTTQAAFCAEDIVGMHAARIELRTEGGNANDAIVKGTTWWSAQDRELAAEIAALQVTLSGCCGYTASLAPGIAQQIAALKAFQVAGEMNDAFLSKVSFTE